ncbi:LarC family nickel insertion protein [Apilactobacillus xinyiensis]|uniref:LarC family nickel insertion protein n=1 Tax=Apilactobacillus xinyiensis TaxID=2841032 RepID=UPI0024B1B9F7|nr:LarC family nickel insertion protein [Apilactobacillus xinyiensis]
MRTLYLDAFSGISGDMFIGALLDLGIDQDAFINKLSNLNIKGYSIKVNKIAQSSIYGIDFDVILDHGQKDTGFVEHHHGHHHHHDARHLSEVNKIIDDSNLSDYVKSNAKQVFMYIATAEAKVHNLPINEVHFHEVGAIDSIVDIIGAFVALEMLEVDKVIASPLTDGSGFIHVAHGMMPVPVPAVMEMRVNANIPINQNSSIKTELITPTGMGIVKTIVSEFGSIPGNQNITKVGYGFGKRKTEQLNALRAVLFEKKN